MSLPDNAFITFYYNDGTFETVQAFTYQLALSKVKKEDPLSFYPFWQYGKNEGENELKWTEDKGWQPVIIKEPIKHETPDVSLEHKPFIAQGLDINGESIEKTVVVCLKNDQIAMHIPGFDSDCTYITKQQAMDFFGLIERE